jgi:hypothetical protein
MKKSFKVIVMNKSVRGKKVKKEKEIIAEIVLENYSSTVVLLFAGNSHVLAV